MFGGQDAFWIKNLFLPKEQALTLKQQLLP